MWVRPLVPIVAAFVALPAAASCNWEWLCNGRGACKQIAVCESIDEIPPPPPDTAPPEVPPIAMRPDTIVPNMGTMTCEHVMRQEPSGRWAWYQACFCADETKARDPSDPFANIVRCDRR